MGLGLKVHVGHVLGLEHDLGLGVDPSYKPCWDHISLLMGLGLKVYLVLMLGLLGSHHPLPLEEDLSSNLYGNHSCDEGLSCFFLEL